MPEGLKTFTLRVFTVTNNANISLGVYGIYGIKSEKRVKKHSGRHLWYYKIFYYFSYTFLYVLV